MTDILVINGPNMNLLGTREPEQYGHETLDSINDDLRKLASENSLSTAFVQSNSESELIEQIHDAPKQDVRFIIINPAAFTHTSVALRDALSGVAIPFIEIHLSNVNAREDFRQQSYFSDIATGVITGLGSHGYELAMRAAIKLLAHIRQAQG